MPAPTEKPWKTITALPMVRALIAHHESMAETWAASSRGEGGQYAKRKREEHLQFASVLRYLEPKMAAALAPKLAPDPAIPGDFRKSQDPDCLGPNFKGDNQ